MYYKCTTHAFLCDVKKRAQKVFLAVFVREASLSISPSSCLLMFFFCGSCDTSIINGQKYLGWTFLILSNSLRTSWKILSRFFLLLIILCPLSPVSSSFFPPFSLRSNFDVGSLFAITYCVMLPLPFFSHLFFHSLPQGENRSPNFLWAIITVQSLLFFFVFIIYSWGLDRFHALSIFVSK